MLLGKQTLTATIGGFALSFMLSGSAYAEDGSKVFTQKCSGCHTIGGGAMVGPDLAGSADWKTSDLVDAIKRMENSVGPLSGEEVDSLVQHLKTPAGKASAATETSAEASSSELPPKAISPAVSSEPGSAETGQQLFLGERKFANGGSSCIACHSGGAAGGTMGPDLTNIADRLNETALVAACEKTSFPVMRAAYAAHPVTKQEAIDLAKYLVSLKGTATQQSQLPPLGATGIAGATLMLGLIAWGYRNRNTSVRSKLQRRR